MYACYGFEPADNEQIALVFKCTADAIFLDDFKSVLDKLSALLLKEIGKENLNLNHLADKDLSRARREHDHEVGLRHQTPETSRHCLSCTCHLKQVNKDSIQHVELFKTDPSARSPSTKEWFDVIDPL